jgi:hypothetical protein
MVQLRDILAVKFEVDSRIIPYEVFKYLKFEEILVTVLKQAFSWSGLSSSLVNSV